MQRRRAWEATDGGAIQVAVNEGNQTPVDQLFVGALVGATVGLSAEALWRTLDFAVAYISAAVLIHVVLNEAIRRTGTSRRLLWVGVVTTILFGIAVVESNMGLGVYTLFFMPIGQDAAARNILVGRALCGALALLPAYQLIHHLLTRVLVSPRLNRVRG